MDALGAVATVAAWTATPESERAGVLAALAQTLGAPWRAGRTAVGRVGLGELVHDGLGQGFVVVPGGWLRLGLSCDDLYVAARARDEGGAQPSWGGMPTAARPTRWVRVRPFLLAIAGVPPEGAARGSDGGHASKAYREAVDAQLEERPGPSAQELIDAYDGKSGPDEGEPAMRIVTPAEAAALVPAGFRLVSEAELEWAFRDGGTTRWIGVPGDVEVTPANRRKALLGELVNGFGLLGFRDLQNLCADGAVDYDVDSPTDQDARATDREARIARWAHTYWQDDDAELFGVLAGNRAVPDEYGESILRLACDLPNSASPGGAPPAPLAEHALTVAALTDDARAQGDALSALGYLTHGRGDDVAATVEAVLAVLPKLAGDTLVDALIWLADVQTRGHRNQTVQPPERRRKDALPEDRAAVRAAVAAGSEAIAARLDDPAPRVRSAATLALTFCVDATAAAKQALAARLGREPEVGVQAALLLALIRLGVGFRAPAPEPLIRAALAVATAFEGTPNVAALVEAAKLPPEPLLAYNFGDLGGVAIGVLRKLDRALVIDAAPELAEHAAAAKHGALAAITAELAFGPPPEQPVAPRLPDELSSVERRVALALVDTPVQFGWHSYGLPNGAAARRRFFGLDDAGPFDRFVVHDGRDVPLWFAAATIAHAGGKVDFDALCADAGPAERLAIFLDRQLYWTRPMPWKLDALLAAATAADPAGARAAVDAARRGTKQVGLPLLRALAATRPGEPLDSHLLAEVELDALAQAPELFAAFSRIAVEARLFAEVKPLLERALASDTWSIGIDTQLTRIAAGLGQVPSPRLARNLLLLGWASGQPAAVRAAVGAAGGHHAAIAEVLAQYDTLPEFTSWPRARAVLPTYAE